MKRCAIASMVRSRTWICAVALAGCLGSSDSASVTLRQFTMSPDAGCTVSGSSATVTGTLTLDTDTGEVSFNISLVGLTPIQQHIHAPGESCTEGFASSIMVILPTGTEVSGTYTLAPALQEFMLQGQHWFIAHTLDQVEGEILGRIIPVCPNDCSEHGTCTLGVCNCDIGWSGQDCSIAAVIPTVSNWGLIITALLTLTSACVLLRTRVSGSTL